MNRSGRSKSPLSSPKKTSNKTSKKTSPIKERSIPNPEQENGEQTETPKTIANYQAEIDRLRKELQEVRNQLSSIQNEEQNYLQNYTALEAIEQKRIHDICDLCKKAPFPNLIRNEKLAQAFQEIKGLFEEMISQSDENQKLREQIVSTDDYIYQKLSKQHNKASDVQFESIENETALSKLQNEFASVVNENTSLKEMTESINFEFLNLKNQEKDLQQEFQRIQSENQRQKEEYLAIRESYEEMKDETEVVNGHREKEKKKMEKKLSIVMGKRDECQQNVDNLIEEQEIIEKSIEDNLQIYEELTAKRNRLDSEIQHLTAALSKWKEQANDMNVLLNS